MEAALRTSVREPDYSGLLALAGTGVIADDYDPKALFTHPRYRGDLANEPAPSYTSAKRRRRSEQPPASDPDDCGHLRVDRNVNDCLIAACAIECGEALLHADTDFDRIAAIEPRLRLA